MIPVSRDRVRKKIRLPLGRKRLGWKREFASRSTPASRDLCGVTESRVMEANLQHPEYEESIVGDYCWFIAKIA